MKPSRLTLVIFDDRARGARQLRLDARTLFTWLVVSMGALLGALALGWTIGELTARL